MFIPEISEKVQNSPIYVGAQFIEPDDNGFDKSNPYRRKRYFGLSVVLDRVVCLC